MVRIIITHLLLLVFVAASAQKPLSADDILKEASQVAAKQKKNVFIIFHASWCGWCHKMDTALNDPKVKKYFQDNYVFRHLVVNEYEEKKREIEISDSLEKIEEKQAIVRIIYDNNGFEKFILSDDTEKILCPDCHELDSHQEKCPNISEKERSSEYVIFEAQRNYFSPT